MYFLNKSLYSSIFYIYIKIEEDYMLFIFIKSHLKNILGKPWRLPRVTSQNSSGHIGRHQALETPDSCTGAYLW